MIIYMNIFYYLWHGKCSTFEKTNTDSFSLVANVHTKQEYRKEQSCKTDKLLLEKHILLLYVAGKVDNLHSELSITQVMPCIATEKMFNIY